MTIIKKFRRDINTIVNWATIKNIKPLLTKNLIKKVKEVSLEDSKIFRRAIEGTSFYHKVSINNAFYTSYLNSSFLIIALICTLVAIIIWNFRQEILNKLIEWSIMFISFIIILLVRKTLGEKKK